MFPGFREWWARNPAGKKRDFARKAGRIEDAEIARLPFTDNCWASRYGPDNISLWSVMAQGLASPRVDFDKCEMIKSSLL